MHRPNSWTFLSKFVTILNLFQSVLKYVVKTPWILLDLLFLLIPSWTVFYHINLWDLMIPSWTVLHLLEPFKSFLNLLNFHSQSHEETRSSKQKKYYGKMHIHRCQLPEFKLGWGPSKLVVCRQIHEYFTSFYWGIGHKVEWTKVLRSLKANEITIV